MYILCNKVILKKYFLLKTNNHEKKCNVFCCFPVWIPENNNEQTIIEIHLSIFSCFTLTYMTVCIERD